MLGPQPLVDHRRLIGLQPVVGPSSPVCRAFFRSLIISMNPALQTVVTDSTRFLNDPMLQFNEKVLADAFRATTIQFMCERVDEYIDNLN